MASQTSRVWYFPCIRLCSRLCFNDFIKKSSSNDLWYFYGISTIRAYSRKNKAFIKTLIAKCMSTSNYYRRDHQLKTNRAAQVISFHLYYYLLYIFSKIFIMLVLLSFLRFNESQNLYLNSISPLIFPFAIENLNSLFDNFIIILFMLSRTQCLYLTYFLSLIICLFFSQPFLQFLSCLIASFNLESRSFLSSSFMLSNQTITYANPKAINYRQSQLYPPSCSLIQQITPTKKQQQRIAYKSYSFGCINKSLHLIDSMMIFKEYEGLDSHYYKQHLISIYILEEEKKRMEEYHTLKVVDGHYSIKDKMLGEGSFAKTYLAVDSRNGKMLACKMIEKKNLIDKINLSKNKSLTKQYFINALKNEVKTWKSIHHSNIVEFIDFSETANNIYFFLQFCSGGNLESYLVKNGHIQEKKAIQLFLQLAQGCAYLESKNIYHRDLKTENILITEEGLLKLSDFGFAKMVSDEQLKYCPTAQTSVGTPIYMAPQIIMGDPYTIKCDVWSLGVVFYKILYNLYPWQKTENIMVLVDRMKKPFDFPPNIQVSKWVRQLICQMLTIDEAKRISIKKVLQILLNEQRAMDVQ